MMEDLRREDRIWMERAFETARAHWGRALPNPCVGAIAVARGEEAGAGWSRPAAEGGAHAETGAIAAAGERARGATLYVTLEPCSHWGKTPPCADAVVRAGFARVVIGARDPNPLVDGRGVRVLRDAGIEVAFEGLDGRIEEAYAGFFHRIREGRPLVELKMAATADGFVAREDGSPMAVTGAEARRWTHDRRALCDAVLVSARTARNDRPRLDVRDSSWPVPHVPARVVAGRRADFSPDDPVFAPDGAPVLLFAREFAPDLPGRAERITLKGETLAECLSETLSELGRRGMHRIWTEPGPELALAMLENGLADRFFLLQSPENALSGLSAKPVLDWLQNAEIARFGHLGRDSLREFRLKPSGIPGEQGD